MWTKGTGQIQNEEVEKLEVETLHVRRIEPITSGNQTQKTNKNEENKEKEPIHITNRHLLRIIVLIGRILLRQ